MREAWTDERLDDLARGMHREFDQVHEEIRSLRVESKGEVSALRGEMNTRFNAVDARFDSLQRTMVIGFASIVASVVGAIAAAVLANAL